MESGEAVFRRGTRLPSSGCSAHAALCHFGCPNFQQRKHSLAPQHTHPRYQRRDFRETVTFTKSPQSGKGAGIGVCINNLPRYHRFQRKTKMWARRGLNVDEKTKKSTVAGNPSCCLDVCPLLCVFLFHILLAVTCFSRDDHQHMPCTVLYGHGRRQYEHGVAPTSSYQKAFKLTNCQK